MESYLKINRNIKFITTHITNSASILGSFILIATIKKTTMYLLDLH